MIKFEEFTNRRLFHLQEMTNLQPSESKIKGGVIYYSTKQGSHGCRIKFEPSNEKGKEFIVTIPKLEISIDTTTKLSNKTKKQVIKFAEVYSDKLLKYWNEGNFLTKSEQLEFKKLLHLSSQQLNAIDNIHLKYKK